MSNIQLWHETDVPRDAPGLFCCGAVLPLLATNGLMHRSKVRKIKRDNSVVRDTTGR